MKNHVVWYRNDLRVDDHAPLHRAVTAAERDGGGVLPVVVVDPMFFGQTRFGFDRIGPYRRRFLKQSLVDLRDTLRGLGGDLRVVRGETGDVFRRLFESGDVASVRFHHEYPPEEKSLERKVVKLARKHDVDVHIESPDTLIDEDDLPFDIRETPEVFSKYRRIVEKKCDPRQPIDAPDDVPPAVLPDGIEATRIEDLSELADTAESSDRGVLDFVGGESAGRQRLADYIWDGDHLKVYKQTRNGMLGADYSSKFSAWLAHGCLSARRVAAEVRRYESERVKNDSTYWLVFELLWRDYFALMVAKHGRHVFTVGGLRREPDYPWKQDAERFDAWREGLTGFPLIDANMREIAATGFMSNRGRQNVGSFLTKNLGIDWRMGAEWFEHLLVDYDPSSNYGNWNYVAGIGNDARGFRWFNTIKQSKDYDPDGDYVRHWCPELSDVPKRFVHTPWEMPPSEQKRCGCVIGVDYPNPVVDLFKSADRHRAEYERAVG